MTSNQGKLIGGHDKLLPSAAAGRRRRRRSAAAGRRRRERTDTALWYR